MRSNPKFSKNGLRYLYWSKQLVIREIAKKLDTSPGTIIYYMNKFKIPRRKTAILIGPNKSQLFNLYWNKNLSEREIAKRLNCDLAKVARRMKAFSIPRRKPENRFNFIKGQLFDLYWNKKLTPARISKIFKCHVDTIYEWLKKFEIPMRNRSEAAIEKFKNPENHLNCPTYGKGDYYKDIWMRSSYEIAFAKYLDRNNIKWFYESERFNLPSSTYTPDFYLPNTNEYIEIKGWWRECKKVKFNLFKQLYPEIKIKVLMKLDLEKLGVLK